MQFEVLALFVIVALIAVFILVKKGTSYNNVKENKCHSDFHQVLVFGILRQPPSTH